MGAAVGRQTASSTLWIEQRAAPAPIDKAAVLRRFRLDNGEIPLRQNVRVPRIKALNRFSCI